MKRFNNGKDKVDFTQPCKLTRQKRLVEAQKESVRLGHKALCIRNIVKAFYISDGQGDENRKIESVII